MVKTNDLLGRFPPSSISVKGTTTLHRILKALILPLFVWPTLLPHKTLLIFIDSTLKYLVSAPLAVSHGHTPVQVLPQTKQPEFLTSTHPAITADLLLSQHRSTMSLTSPNS